MSQYTIGADGALTPMPTATVGTGSNPTSVTVDPSGKYAYVGSNYASNTVSLNSRLAWTVRFRQWLWPVSAPAPFRGPSPWIRLESMPVSQINRVMLSRSTRLVLPARSRQCLPSVSAPVPGPPPNVVSVDPTGKYAYVANGGTNTISQFAIGADGALTPMLVASVGAGILRKPSPWMRQESMPT